MKSIDLKEGGREVALKISRNKKFDTDNANVEFKLIQMLNEKDPDDKKGVVRVLDSFSFRRHVVIVFELLGQNIYKHMYQPGQEVCTFSKT